MPDRNFSFILIPAEPLKSQLNLIVEKLARDYDAAPFAPHVTVYTGPSSDSESRGIAERIVRRFSSVELTFGKLDCTKLFYKTLFVQFHPAGVLQEMFEAIKTDCIRPSSYRLNPHLSLMYQRIPAAEQARLCETLIVPQQPYRLDGLRVIETDISENCDAVRRWRTVFEGRLGS